MRLRFLSEQTRILLILFTGYTLAVLQNVTVDDAAMTGDAVPQYLPTGSGWNISNKCPRCRAKPDPNLAYNGTWHDATFSATVGYTQSIEFSYTGSSLYIFFIIANTIQYTTTFTGVNFMLDGVLVGSYTHIPTTSTNYEYNVPVYANDSVPFGDHSVTIQPITNLGHVLILFDYLIYTIDAPSPALPSSGTPLPAGTSTVTTPSPTSSMTQRTYSRSAIGTIAGGTVGGIVAAIILVVALILYYRRYVRRNDGIPPAERDMVNPFIIPGGVASAPLTGTTSSTHPVGPSVTNPLASKNNTFESSVTPPSSVPPTSTTQSSSSGEPSSSSSALLQQVGILRNEVAHLRSMHEANEDGVRLPLEAPPEYTS